MIDFIQEIRNAVIDTRFDFEIKITENKVETERAVFIVTEDGVLVFDKNMERLNPEPAIDQDEIEAILAYFWS